MGEARRRSGGRRDRIQQRELGPENPCPPGQRGGLYRPLSDDDLAAIYETALKLLAELGMGEVPPRLTEYL
ncbi:MAG: hypothetical protein AAGA78_13890 [Pseudomonadota bacterium]